MATCYSWTLPLAELDDFLIEVYRVNDSPRIVEYTALPVVDNANGTFTFFACLLEPPVFRDPETQNSVEGPTLTTGGVCTSDNVCNPSPPPEPLFDLTLVRSDIAGGTVTDNTNTSPYLAGSEVSISATVNAGYIFLNWQDDQGAVVSFLTDFTYVMPLRDVTLTAVFIAEVPPFEVPYGVKYFFEYNTNKGNLERVEILEREYVGASSERKIQNVVYEIGERGSELFNTFAGSRISLDIAANNSTDFLDLLTGDDRLFRVKYFRSGVLFFDGYLIADYFVRPEISIGHIISLVATDGLKGLSSRRYNPINFERQFTNQPASISLVQCFIDDFAKYYPVRSIVSILEERMTSLDPYEGFGTLYETFTEIDDGELLPITTGKALEILATCFMARVFFWKSNWYIQRSNELARETQTYHEYNTYGRRVASGDIISNQAIVDVFNAEREGSVAFTEITASLNLADLVVPEGNFVKDGNFEANAWQNLGSERQAEWKLRFWDYVRVGVQNRPIGDLDTAIALRVTGQDNNNFLRLFGTGFGLTNGNLAYVASTGVQISVENGNLISVSFRYKSEKILPDFPNVPNGHFAVFRLRIGNFYLSTTDFQVFSWVETPSNINIPLNNIGVWNSFSAQDLEVPENGEVEFRLYQITTTLSGTFNRYTIDFDDVSVLLSKNDAFTYEKVFFKGVADRKFINVFPEYETFIGDAFTNMNQASMRLLSSGSPVTNTWARAGVVEALPLLNITVQSLADLVGDSRQRVFGLVKQDIDFRKPVQYDGKSWGIAFAALDTQSELWSVELIEL